MESKTDLSCDIVKDLLPVYCDGQASSDSVEAVEEHLKQCPDCKKMYEEMSGNLELEQAEELDRDISVLEKMKRRVKVKVFVCFLIGAALCAFLFSVFFVGIVPVESGDAVITYEAYKGEMTADDENVDTYEVVFHVKLPEGTTLNFRGDAENGKKGFKQYYKLYRVWSLPFDDRGKYPNQADLGRSSDKPFTEEDEFVIQFRDKTVVYSLKEIAEAAGIQ
ncbi:MAG: anti-sigma factor family protein [Lachnospiraceae bacterium]